MLYFISNVEVRVSMKISFVFGLIFIILIGLFLSGCSREIKPPYLKLEKTDFEPGEVIIVTFAALPEYEKSAWVGIIPSFKDHGKESENDKWDLTYQYLNGRTEGMLKFKAPTKPGDYDLRMHDTDNNGIEVCHISFTVN